MNIHPIPDPRVRHAEPDEALARREQDEAFAQLADALAPESAAPGALRQRLLGRVAESAARHQGLITVRQRQARPQALAAGVAVRWLYAAGARTRRPGEPERVGLVELAPGARLVAGLGLARSHSEWLVAAGSAAIDSVELGWLDHHGRAATPGEPFVVAGAQGALLYLRDCGDEPTPAGTTRESPERWEDYAPGIRRRLLWQSGNASAYLARALDGAAVPAHGHRHDEECLMIEGDLFTGDILLRQGDFQLSPAGVNHGLVQAGSDCVVYIRGDAELDILPAA